MAYRGWETGSSTPRPQAAAALVQVVQQAAAAPVVASGVAWLMKPEGIRRALEDYLRDRLSAELSRAVSQGSVSFRIGEERRREWILLGSNGEAVGAVPVRALWPYADAYASEFKFFPQAVPVPEVRPGQVEWYPQFAGSLPADLEELRQVYGLPIEGLATIAGAGLDDAEAWERGDAVPFDEAARIVGECLSGFFVPCLNRFGEWATTRRRRLAKDRNVYAYLATVGSDEATQRRAAHVREQYSRQLAYLQLVPVRERLKVVSSQDPRLAQERVDLLLELLAAVLDGSADV